MLQRSVSSSSNRRRHTWQCASSRREVGGLVVGRQGEGGTTGWERDFICLCLLNQRAKTKYFRHLKLGGPFWNFCKKFWVYSEFWFFFATSIYYKLTRTPEAVSQYTIPATKLMCLFNLTKWCGKEEQQRPSTKVLNLEASFNWWIINPLIRLLIDNYAW